MHNIDRTQLEYPGELYETGYEQLEYPGEMGYEMGFEQYESPGELGYEQMEYPGELYEAGFNEASFGEFGMPGEMYEAAYTELGYEYPGEMEYGTAFEGVFSEQEEIALAAELLEINSEAELEQFLGKLAKRAMRAVGRAIPGPVRNQLLGILRTAARKALPIAGAALGNLVAPGIGGVLGGKLAAAAGARFGLELEGLSAEDREFEIARRFVRLSGDAVRNAAAQPLAGPPATVAQQAVLMSAQQHAPGLAAELSAAFEYQEQEYGGYAPRPYGRQTSGQWYRRGNRIVLVGA